MGGSSPETWPRPIRSRYSARRTAACCVNLLADRGIALKVGAYAEKIERGKLHLRPSATLEVGHVVALSQLEGPALPVLPCDGAGVTRRGRAQPGNRLGVRISSRKSRSAQATPPTRSRSSSAQTSPSAGGQRTVGRGREEVQGPWTPRCRIFIGASVRAKAALTLARDEKQKRRRRRRDIPQRPREPVMVLVPTRSRQTARHAHPYCRPGSLRQPRGYALSA